MKVLVTGGNGFIGSNLVEKLYLDPKFTEIRILDIDDIGSTFRTYNDKVCFIKGSICDQEIVEKAVRDCNAVFHLAALTSVPDSFKLPLEFVNTNEIGSIILLEACKKFGVEHFIFSSSCAVLELDSVYAITKKTIEEHLKFYTQFFKVTILRYYNVYGPNENLTYKKHISAVANFMDKAKKNEPIEIYGDGKQLRDFIHVEDIARFNVFCFLENLQGTFHLGTGKSTSILEVAKLIKINLNSSSKILLNGIKRSGDTQEIFCEKSPVDFFEFKWRNFEDGIKNVITCACEQLS